MLVCKTTTSHKKSLPDIVFQFPQIICSLKNKFIEITVLHLTARPSQKITRIKMIKSMKNMCHYTICGLTDIYFLQILSIIQ
jgi:hypothetical protein